MRQELELKAKELKIKFTKETSDEALGLMIQLAEKDAELKQTTEVNAELAEKLVKMETAAESGTGREVIKHGKDMYYTNAKKFHFNPVKQNQVKRGAGGIVGRGRESVKGARTILMKDIEAPENKDALDWLVDTGSSLLTKVESKDKGGK